MVYSYLERLQEEYLEEKILVEKSISNLQIKLKENIKFIKLLDENIDVSYESFSPRDVHAKNKAKIKELKENQKDILSEIDEEKKKNEKIVKKLDELNEILEIVKSASVKEGRVELDHDDYRLTLLETQENERQRISRELHDSTVQNLTGMVHKVELCSKLIDIDPIRCKLELSMMSRTLRDIINDTRQMIYNLRPMSFDDIGLEITMERALEKIKTEKICNINFSVEGEPYQINPIIGITLLRITQEACNNAIKYAASSLIIVKLIYEENAVSILVEDNGKGFDIENLDVSGRTDNSGFGLLMMKERVYLLSGEISIHSEKESGTRISVRVPIVNKEEK